MKTLFFARSALLLTTLAATGGVLIFAPSILVKSAQAAPRVPASLLITTKSIGPARLGNSVASLKRAFPGSTIVEEGEEGGYYVLKKNGQELMKFYTRESTADEYNGKMRDADILTSMWTSDPHFKTAKGIGPGSWMHNAVAVYGKPRISFSPHEETGTFPTYSKTLWFEPEAPRDPNSDYRVAGVYTAQELKRLEGTTTRFKRGTRLTSIGCSEKYYG